MMIADNASDLIRGRTALEAVVVRSIRSLRAHELISARLCNIVHFGTTRVAGNDDGAVAAPDNSEEAATCKRRAPLAQKAKMGSDYRTRFRARHWPTNT